MNTGMFYVIEGFLDVILPVADMQPHDGSDTKTPSQENLPSDRMNRQPTFNHEVRQTEPPEEGKHLFTVKPGGIAGYLCKEALNFWSDPMPDPSSIVVQHGLVRRHQGKNGHMCGLPPTSCFGTVIGETSNCPFDAC